MRDAQVWWLSALGWTQREIAEVMGISNGEVAATCSENPEWKKLSKEQAGRGRTPEQTAETEGVPEGARPTSWRVRLTGSTVPSGLQRPHR